MTNFTLSPTFDAANASQKAELLLRRLGEIGIAHV